MQEKTQADKWDRARTLLLESLYKPDTKLRGCAYNQHCFDEMLVLRDEVIDYVSKLENPHSTKPLSKWR
jgi:hypothetical protein|tara:strand:+ start:310 stop:516 length:207 start_codon:yes stop_codon:yes gene_type:complete